MERIDALKELLAKVEANESIRWFEFSPAISLRPDDRVRNAARANHGSLDAAKALHDAVLPNLEWILGEGGASVYDPVVDPGTDFDGWEAQGDIPARSWLCAIIKALIAQEES